MSLDGVTAVPVMCRRGRHTLDLPRLRLQTPTVRDLMMMAAVGSDPEAQRWLGWPPEHVVSERYRDRILTKRPGRGKLFRVPVAGTWGMIVVDRASGMIAGQVTVQIDAGEVGGSLAPRFRSRGLGAEFFRGAALFAHHVLGAGSIRAGAETTNTVCIRALRSAGFVPTTGPSVHQLSDGRTIASLWFRHDAEPTPRCRAVS